MAIKHFLFVNSSGKKFKTTQSGKIQTMNNKKLMATVKYLGECNDKGQLVTETVSIPKETVQSIKEIMQKAMDVGPEIKVSEIKEEKFVEPKIKTKKDGKKTK